MAETNTWDLSRFRELVKQLRGEPTVDELNRHIGALSWKLRAANYHMDEASRAISTFFDGRGDDEVREAVRLIMGAAESRLEAQEYRNALFMSEAHVIACAQSLHSTADIMGQVVWGALQLQSRLSARIRRENRIGPRSRYFFRIVQAMRDAGIAADVAAEADDFLQHDDFRYLAGYVNTTKHHSLIPTRHSAKLDPWPHREHGLRFDKVATWGEMWADDFMTNTYETVRGKLECIGAALNAELEAESGSRDV